MTKSSQIHLEESSNDNESAATFPLNCIINQSLSILYGKSQLGIYFDILHYKKHVLATVFFIRSLYH